MSNAETSGYQVGQTALIIKVPEAEPLVGDWRSLPIATLVSGIQLLHFTGKRWQEQHSFRLGSRRAG